MIDRLALWLGDEAEDAWQAHLDQCEADAEEQRQRREEIDE